MVNKLINIMAFDFGTKKIGVAVGQSITGTASPLPVVQVNKQDHQWHVINDYVNDWQPDAFVVGLPLNRDGERQEVTELAEIFAAGLTERLTREVFWVDERYTSQAANTILKAQDARSKKKNSALNKDSVAAVLILESWFRSV